MATVGSPSGRPTTFAGAGLRGTRRPITFSASYTTGGEAVTAAQVGLNSILFAVATPSTASAGAVANVVWDQANGKLKALTTTAEVANTTNLSGVTCEVLFFGI